MRERGLLQPGGTTMQHIVAWLRANPEEGRAIMRENLSYIFFQELTGPGPLGSLGLPVTPRVTVAADPKFVPLGRRSCSQLDRRKRTASGSRRIRRRDQGRQPLRHLLGRRRRSCADRRRMTGKGTSLHPPSKGQPCKAQCAGSRCAASALRKRRSGRRSSLPSARSAATEVDRLTSSRRLRPPSKPRPAPKLRSYSKGGRSSPRAEPWDDA
jgi:hypothetical protein